MKTVDPLFGGLLYFVSVTKKKKTCVFFYPLTLKKSRVILFLFLLMFFFIYEFLYLRHFQNATISVYFFYHVALVTKNHEN